MTIKVFHRAIALSAISLSLAACLNKSEVNDKQVQEGELATAQSVSVIKTDKNFINAYSNDVVWAVNLAGGDYLATNGVLFEDGSDLTELTSGRVDKILGSQDSTLYQTYLEGDFAYSKALPNGKYDVTFLFAEPEQTEVGSRVFDVVVNGQVELENIDIRGLRDGKAFSALDKTVNQIEVTQEQLNIELKAITGKPAISAIIVRKHTNDDAAWQLVWQDEFDYEGGQYYVACLQMKLKDTGQH